MRCAALTLAARGRDAGVTLYNTTNNPVLCRTYGTRAQAVLNHMLIEVYFLYKNIDLLHKIEICGKNVAYIRKRLTFTGTGFIC